MDDEVLGMCTSISIGMTLGYFTHIFGNLPLLDALLGAGIGFIVATAILIIMRIPDGPNVYAQPKLLRPKGNDLPEIPPPPINLPPKIK